MESYVYAEINLIYTNLQDSVNYAEIYILDVASVRSMELKPVAFLAKMECTSTAQNAAIVRLLVSPVRTEPPAIAVQRGILSAEVSVAVERPALPARPTWLSVPPAFKTFTERSDSAPPATLLSSSTVPSSVRPVHLPV